MNIAAKLDAAVRAVCPIYGVSIGRLDDKATWRIDFADEATAEQRAAAQNVLEAFDPEARSNEEIKADLEAVLDDHVDATARGMGYRSSESCAGYAASTDPVFQAEALAFIAWRDDLWRDAIAVMQAVLAGQRAVPTATELVAEMPVFQRPEA